MRLVGIVAAVSLGDLFGFSTARHHMVSIHAKALLGDVVAFEHIEGASGEGPHRDGILAEDCRNWLDYGLL